MQHTITIALNGQPVGGSLKSRVLKTLNAHKAAVELMLQGYHSREKVRHVCFEEGSLIELAEGALVVNAIYTVEEFSVCSDTDTEESLQMKLAIQLSEEAKALTVAGIDIPEREPDSL